MPWIAGSQVARPAELPARAIDCSIVLPASGARPPLAADLRDDVGHGLKDLLRGWIKLPWIS
jgi:hypothetical protein